MRTDESDEGLVNAARDGSRDAYGLLFERHRDRALKIVLARSHLDLDSAEDLVQEVFMKGYKGLHQLRGDFENWITRIVVNTLNSSLKRREVLSQVTDQEECAQLQDESPQPLELAQAAEVVGVLGDVISDLGDEEQRIVVAVFRDERNQKDLAMECGMSQSKVSRKLDKILKKIHSKLRKLGIGE